MSSTDQTPVESPCVGICAMNDDTGFCEGCYRTIDEIRDWWDMQPGQQRSLLESLAERQMSCANFD